MLRSGVIVRTFDRNFVLAGSRMRKQINLNRYFTHAFIRILWICALVEGSELLVLYWEYVVIVANNKCVKTVNISLLLIVVTIVIMKKQK